MDIKPATYYFEDDGSIPNNKLPLLVYRNTFSERGSAGAVWLENHFKSNSWYNSWRNGVFPYHHYHSITHEVLGVYEGSATLLLGGEKGEKLEVRAGDILVIPAGVGHKNLGSSKDFAVAGAYPDGMDYDILKGRPEDRPRADENIARVPVPHSDPLLGNKEGLTKIWNQK
jgi:uncharacterized protein YjlB